MMGVIPIYKAFGELFVGVDVLGDPSLYPQVIIGGFI